jgi:hypothetical protein
MTLEAARLRVRLRVPEAGAGPATSQIVIVEVENSTCAV